MDSWSEQRIWDAFLYNVRVVVSTYQVLLDALSHAFVKMSTLALMVFDEGSWDPIRPGASILANI